MSTVAGFTSLSLMDILIYEDRFMTISKFVQTQFPKSKKKRIRNKWRKKFGRWLSVPNPALIRTPFGIVGHPDTIAKLMKRLTK